VAELFAGVGGFRIGLARAGWETVFSNQWEPSTKLQHASDVYVARFGPEGHTNMDIASLAEVPESFDLLVGGFPCQDYSVAKSKTSATGLEGKKGVLWWEILRLVNRHKPNFIFLENVDRLLKSPSSQRGRDFAVMLATLGNEGYQIEWRIVNSADYGFPQRRIRVFIVAKKLEILREGFQPMEYLTKSGTLARALPINKRIVEKWAEFEINSDAENVSKFFNKDGTHSPFQNAGMYRSGKVYTFKPTPMFRGRSVTLGDILVDPAEVPEEFWIDPKSLDSWKYLKGAKSEERVHQSSGFKYNYSEGPIAFPDPLERPSRTILTGEGGKTPSRFKHVVKIQRRYRRLTPLELERLAGFPDNWTELPGKVSDGRRAFFVGNALVIGLVERIGKQIAADQIELKSFGQVS
jgi:DNA (cytosine-5)-methyltransferase 1